MLWRVAKVHIPIMMTRYIAGQKQKNKNTFIIDLLIIVDVFKSFLIFLKTFNLRKLFDNIYKRDMKVLVDNAVIAKINMYDSQTLFSFSVCSARVCMVFNYLIRITSTQYTHSHLDFLFRYIGNIVIKAYTNILSRAYHLQRWITV